MAEPTISSRPTAVDIPALPLSVVVATTRAWPEIEPCLQSLHHQVQAVGGEVVVGDGHGQGLPADAAGRYPEVKWIKTSGASVFVLRQLAMANSSGAVVAVTEDHCTVSPDWCERILQAHRDFPEAAAIGGAVENGATTRLIDWANFLIIFGAFTSPIRTGVRPSISLQANASYKRRVIQDAVSERGFTELFFNRELHARGEILRADERLIVSHNQTYGLWGTFVAHFHNGRSIAGLRLPRMAGPERLLRLAGCAVLPAYLLALSFGPVIRRRRLLKPALACLPLAALVASCHAAGEVVGSLFGPGLSPEHLR